MVKRRYVKKTKSYKKKRMMKKSYRRRFKKTNYDGVIYVKSAMVKNLFTSATVG